MTDIWRPAPGYRFIILPWAGSSNALLNGLAEEGAGHGTVLLVRRQTAGRGRRGRTWISPPGNLYMSVLLRPDRPAAIGGHIGFLAGLAVAEALAPHIGGSEIALKWPNDVLVDGRKIAGLLPEAAVQGDRLSHVVLGIGVNLASAPQADVRWPAAALADVGAAGVDPVALAAGVTHRLAHWIAVWERDGFEPVRAAWMARAWGLGRTFRVEEGGVMHSGRFEGIDPEGALLLVPDDGGRRTVRSGDVRPAEAM